ncbi:fibronectin type III domain-containing protein, partial [candidate division WWE3 bacterium]|nr:fibronectin type III domain-containing protein [candidate division WWE3 bacterium]
QGNTWITSSNDQYYLNIKTIDVANNIYPTSESFAFKLDNTPPTNPIGLSAPQGFLRNIDSFTIAWATTGSNMATDTHSGIAGYQYKINDSGEWNGINHSGSEDCTDLLTSSTYVLDETFDTLVTGENTFYLRTWDTACNTSTDPLVAILKYNADAPSAPQNLIVTPATNTANAFSFNWQEPETFQGSATGLSYCYTVNTIPSQNTCTFTSQATLATDAYATQPGENRLYVSSKDEAGNINYSDYASVVFTANTPAPGSPTDIDVADVSIKNKEAWRLTASWLEPENTGAGIASYRIYRSNLKTECSSDSSAFEQIATTSGTSYVDSDLTQQDYYYCVRACDSANNCSAVSGTATGYPDGKYTVPAPLLSGPVVIGVSTRQATVDWLTERTADSRVAYGLTSGNYFEEEPSNSNHVTTHSITLNNLDPGTTYYYVAKWTDEDGNTGTSEEKSFTTQPAPTVKSVSVPTIGLDAALIRFTTQNASKVRIYYGPTTAFGGAIDVATSITESSYTAVLDGLNDGTLYNFKINAFDTDGFEYEGTILDFTTIPRPELSNIRLQQITGTAQPSVLVTWDSNTEVSSIVRYYPEDNPAAAQDSVVVERISGEHRAVISGLLPQTSYNLIVLGQDRLGNEARSDVQRFTTATDTRPPGITNLQVNSSIIKNEAGENSAQITVSWDTDEPTTAQVEFGEGTGTTYAQSTQEDTNLTFNHLVVISGLSPSKVYHLRALSKDSAGNLGQSIDTVTITPKATDNALDLVIQNLQQIFGFLVN